jgi:tellurium resistance protein TerZ
MNSQFVLPASKVFVDVDWTLNKYLIFHTSTIIFDSSGAIRDICNCYAPTCLNGAVTTELKKVEQSLQLKKFAEAIIFDFQRIPQSVEVFVIVLNCFTKESFNAVELLNLKIAESGNEHPITQVYFNPKGSYSTLVFCFIHRLDEEITNTFPNGKSQNMTHIDTSANTNINTNTDANGNNAKIVIADSHSKWILRLTMEKYDNQTIEEFISVIQQTRLKPLLKTVDTSSNINAIRNTIIFPVTLNRGDLWFLPPSINKIVVGVGWNILEGNESIDLDVSCCLFDTRERYLEGVFYEKLEATNKSVVHLGENLAVDRIGDSEQIVVDFTKLDVSVRALIFCVNSYSRIPFSKTQSVFVHVLDHSIGKELARLDFSEFLIIEQKFTALVLCSIYKDTDDKWILSYIGEPADGRTYLEIMPAIRDEVRRIINRIKVPWDVDESVAQCTFCKKPFTLVRRKHHCRGCGHIYCSMCTKKRKALPKWGYVKNVRVCDACYQDDTK